tara:strand:+ start:797 stop:1846 length:1050 start_codon:yes stop_codon:yes gene_type:complete
MPQLDGLRALAVAAVAFSHWLPKNYHSGLPWGPGGVQLFFVLSGFLITGILLRCREHENPWHSARAFYARRFLRIFPLFYAVLLVGFFLNIHPIRESILWHISYFSNFYFVAIGGWNGPISHFWSLAVEEQFYLFWPAVILLIPRHWLKPSLVGLIAIGLVSRFCLPILFPNASPLEALPNSNFDALGLGALLAYTTGGIISRPIVPWLFVGGPAYFGFLGLRLLDFEIPFQSELEHTAMLLFFAWVVSKASTGFHGVTGAILQLPPLLYLGKVSYGLYIFHNFASLPVQLLAKTLDMPSIELGPTRVAMMTIFTILAASLSWHMFEYPLNKLKRHFPYKKPGETAPQI